MLYHIISSLQPILRRAVVSFERRPARERWHTASSSDGVSSDTTKLRHRALVQKANYSIPTKLDYTITILYYTILHHTALAGVVASGSVASLDCPRARQAPPGQSARLERHRLLP